MADYALPTFTNKLGTFTITLTSTVAALTVPTVNTVKSISPLRESLDLIPGTLDIPTLTMEVYDSGAFWSAALVGTCSVLILLDEGSGDTFVFRGVVIPGDTSFTEIYNDNTTVYRSIIKFTAKSYVTLLENVTIDALVTDIITNHMTAGTTPQGQYCKVLDVFNSAIELAYGQAYAADTAYLQFSNKGINESADLIFTDSGTGDHCFENIYFMVEDNSTPTGYSNSSDTTNYWGVLYGNAWELIKDICFNFCLVPQYTWDVATSTHKLRLLQRGRVYAAGSVLSLDAPSESEYSPGSQQYLQRIHVTRREDADKSWYYNGGVYTEGDIPAQFDSQLTIRTLFNIDPTGLNLWTLLYYISSGDALYITQMTAYLYTAGSGTIYSTGTNILQKALVYYLSSRYYDTQKMYYRTYPNMQVTGTHTDIDLMKQTTINSVTYDIVEYEKDFASGEVKLTLVDI